MRALSRILAAAFLLSLVGVSGEAHVRPPLVAPRATPIGALTTPDARPSVVAPVTAAVATASPRPTFVAFAAPSARAVAAAPSGAPTATPSPAEAQAATDAGAFAALDDAMATILAQGGFPGGALAVVRDGRLVYTNGYGLADAVTRAPYTPTTLSRIASLSKIVTLSRLRQMIAAGQLSWDTRAFPLLGVAPADARANDITVRELATHTSGIASDYLFEARQAAAAYGVASPPDVDAMIRWVAHYPLAAAPGTTAHYLNTNYAILSRVMERASGRAWIDLLRDMGACAGISRWRLAVSLAHPSDEARYHDASTTESVFDTAPGRVAWPYGGYDVAAFAGAVSLVSSVVDLARYGAALGRCIPRPEDDPIPTRPGYAYSYPFEGSMPGQLTFFLRRWDGAHLTQLVAFFDARTGGPFDATVPDVLWAAAARVPAWPAGDRFAQYR